MQMADEEPQAPIRRRTRKAGETPSRDDGRRVEGRSGRRNTPDESGTRDNGDGHEASGEGGPADRGASKVDLGSIARCAAHLVAELTGRRPESVISIERRDEE